MQSEWRAVLGVSTRDVVHTLPQLGSAVRAVHTEALGADAASALPASITPSLRLTCALLPLTLAPSKSVDALSRQSSLRIGAGAALPLLTRVQVLPASSHAPVHARPTDAQ